MPCLRQVTSKEAKVERRRARDDPLWKAPQPSQSEKLQQEGPEFQVRKKMGNATLYNQTRRIRLTQFWAILTSYEFGIIRGYLGTPSHQMPLLKFFTSIWCGKWQEWAANPNNLEPIQKNLAWLGFRSTHESCKYAHEVFHRSSLNCIHLGCRKRRAIFSWAVFKTLVTTFILVSSFGPLEWLVAILK